MKLLDQFTSNSEELVAFQKERRLGSKQAAATKAHAKTNKRYASGNLLNVFATQAQASTKANQDKPRGKEDVPCIFCLLQEPGSTPSHPVSKCKRPLTFGAKAAILKDNDACWIYLAKTNHNSKTCKSKYNCYKCKKNSKNDRHHLSLLSFDKRTATNISTLYQLDSVSLIRRKIKLVTINDEIELRDFHQYESSTAKRALITLAQHKAYQKEFKALQLNEELPKSSPS